MHTNEKCTNVNPMNQGLGANRNLNPSTQSHIALNFPANYKFYTKYELSYEDRSRAVSGLKISLKVCRTKM